MPPAPQIRTRKTSAFSLVEVTLAIGILASCAAIILGLLPVSLNSIQESSQRTQAANFIQSIRSDLALAGTGTSPRYGLSSPINDTFYLDDNGRIVSESDAQYRVFLDVNVPSGSGISQPLAGRIRISWPAGAEIDQATGYLESFLAILP